MRLLSPRSHLRPSKLSVFTHGSYFPYCHFATMVRQGFFPGMEKIVAHNLFDWIFAETLLSRIGTIAVMTDKEGSDLRRAFHLKESQIFVSPNFKVAQPTGESAPKRKIPTGPYVFAVGRVEPRKNFQAVPSALAGLGVSFVLAGTDEGGLRTVMNEARSQETVPFDYLGMVSDTEKRWLISHAVATILPSYIEGVPFSVLESLELGVPAIVTSTSYVPPWEGVYYCTPTSRNIREVVTRLMRGHARIVPPQIPDERTAAFQLYKRISGS